MVERGNPTFYQYDADGQKIGYYNPQEGVYRLLTPDTRVIRVASLRSKEVAVNAGASVLDMGDGVALLEIHSPAASIDQDVIEMVYEALEITEKDFEALVIGHDGERFSVGANLFMVALAIQSGDIDRWKAMHRQSQDMMQAIRFSGKPVVIAPHNMALGGGAEMIMAGSRVVAHAELYAGLVEVGVGIIPAWGGCKEMVRRIVNPVMESHPNGDPLPHLQKVFEQIALAKVSESAKQARDMGILGTCDRIVMNRDHLLGEAKREALHLAANYTPTLPGKVYAAGRDAYAALLLGVQGFVEGGYASEHDALIARKLAWVLTGGAISEPGWIDEQVFLDLERAAFLELVQTEKTLARIGYMLENNKPLRN
jgi:3-hydroxyacyl-CoA dehydrogenase